MDTLPQEQTTDPPIYEELNIFNERNRRNVSQRQGPGHLVAQSQSMSGPTQQVPYLAPSVQQVEVTVKEPGYPGPNDFSVLALVTLIVCWLLNYTSLFLGIPAVVLALQSKHQRTVKNDYKAAKKKADTAIGLIIATMIYTTFLNVIFVMSVVVVAN